MILTCPNCSCKFKVGLAVFGRDGRNVKCSSCKETWFQEPSLEDVTEEIAEEAIPKDVFEPEEVEIAEAAEAEVSEEEFVQNSQDRVDDFKSDQGRKLAYYVAGGLFLIILAFLLLISSPMLKAHPSTQSFYKLFGIGMDLPDMLSIMFEGVKAEREGSAITASGRIVNLSRRKWALPMIEVVVFRPIVDAEGKQNEEIIAQWVEKPPEPSVESEMEVPFSFSRHVSFGEKMHNEDSHEEKADDGHGLEEVEGDHKDVYMVRVHFILMPQQEVDEEPEDEEEAHEAEEHEDAAHDETDAHDAPEKHDTHETGH